MRAAYDPLRAAYLARASKMAYSKAHFDVDGTQVFLVNSDEDTLTFAFRGTEIKEPRDILTDLWAFFNHEDIHTGFYDAYYKVHEELDKLMDIFHYKDIYLTGHSLGGALATIAASKLDRPNLKACYTFGSPRVGDADLDSMITCPIYRFVNHSDIVPRLPLLTMGYRHAGDLRYLTKEGRVVRCPSSLITEGGFALSLLKGIKHTIDDHSIDEYVRKLDAKEAKEE